MKKHLLTFLLALAIIAGAGFVLPELFDETTPSEEPIVSSGPTAISLADDYYEVTGPAEIPYSIGHAGIVYCPLDKLDRATCVYGELTQAARQNAQERGRQDILVDPAGWPEANREVTIPALSDVPGSRDYHGWLWNRSHLIADSLGADPIPENLVTGTRMQNVGSVNNSGGMAYTETLARDYLDSPAAADSPLYYAVTPIYSGDELVPRSVTVDIKSRDGSIDQHVIVHNVANGFDIDYSDGSWTQK